MCVVVVVPGLEKRDLKIQVNQLDKTMTVSGERFAPMPTQDPELATTKHINKFERAFGTFTRTVTLPDSADSQLISAKCAPPCCTSSRACCGLLWSWSA